MNQSYLSANQLLAESEVSSHRYNLFKTLLGSSDAVPLDGHGTFSLIKTQKYKATLSTMDEGQKMKEKIQEKCYSLNLHNVELKKQVELLRAQIKKFQENQVKFERFTAQIIEQQRNSQQRIIDLESQLQKTIVKSQSQFSRAPDHLSNSKVRRSIQKQTAIQTDWYWEEGREDKRISEQNMQKQANSVSIAEERLYSLLKANTDKFETQFKDKLAKLQESQALLDQWQQEKEEYKQENQKLKSQLTERNLEDEKLKIWQQSILKMVDKAEKSIYAEPSHSMTEEEEEWKKDAMKKGRLAEMQLRIKQAEELMRIEDEEAREEGSVVTLVRLTQKVKELVKNLLVEASYK